MGRRRQKDEGPVGDVFDIIVGAVGFAWRAPPLHGFLMGLGVAIVLCVLIPALLSTGETPGPAGMAAGAILGLFSTLSRWAGGLGAVLCFGCAVINLGRDYAGKAPPAPRIRASRGSASPRHAAASARVGTTSTQHAEPRIIPDIPFIRKELMTPTELKFFKRLLAAFPDVHVCPQVALAALVDIPAYFNNNQYKYANRAPFAAKYADFVIVDLESGDVHAIIELDDHTHDGAERQAEDRARDQMLEEVGIPVHRFDARKMPDIAELQAWLEAD